MKLQLTNRIIKNQRYLAICRRIQEFEKERVFCGHDMEHFLSVARIAMLMCAEEGLSPDPEVIYAAALLHDIGRAEEYTNGTPHDEAGAVIAGEILDELECPQDMKAEIVSLIASHRRAHSERSPLESVFYRADKKSRMCFFCKAADICNWDETKRNNEIGV